MAQDINTTFEMSPTNPRPELSAKPADRRPLLIGIGAAVLVIVIFGGLGWLLFVNPGAAAILRDIVLIFLGLGAILIILLLVALVVITTYLVLKVNDLVKLLDREIKPILLKLQGTVTSVQGTTSFISDQAVRPVISTASNVAAVRAIVRNLFRQG